MIVSVLFFPPTQLEAKALLFGVTVVKVVKWEWVIDSCLHKLHYSLLGKGFALVHRSFPDS